MNENYKGTSTPAKKHRIYSAKPAPAVKKLGKLNNSTYDKRAYPMSPGGKLNETKNFKFTVKTTMSSEFKQSFGNPYQTMQKTADSFLNIEKHLVKKGTKSTARSTESSLSNLTLMQNYKTFSQLQILDQLRGDNDVKVETKRPNVDRLEELLVNTNAMLKRMSFCLQGLVSNGDNRVVLVKNEPKEFEILDDLPLH